jgi:hypothetical protein
LEFIHNGRGVEQEQLKYGAEALAAVAVGFFFHVGMCGHLFVFVTHQIF